MGSRAARKKRKKIREALSEIEKGCENKKRYEKLSKAYMSLNHISQVTKEKGLHVYPCKWCGGHHIGHKRRAG